MIRLGLRMGVIGGLRTSLPTAVTTVATAIGALLLLLILSIGPAMQARADRVAWISSPYLTNPASVGHAADGSVTYIATSTDHIGAEAVLVVDVAGTGPSAPVPPGIAALPGVGEVVMSPALRELVASNPPARDRYGADVGDIADVALEGPDALVAVRGVAAADAALAGLPVTRFAEAGTVPELSGVLGVLLLVAAVGAIAPVMLLVTIGTRLTVRSREKRLAALRLVGATRAQVAQLAAVESVVPSTVGALLGCALMLALRPAAAHVSYDAGRWFPSDLTPAPWGFVAVVVGVPIATVVATLLTLSRVQDEPMSTARGARASRVRSWRAAALLVALPAAYLLVAGASAGDVLGGGADRATAVAFALLMIGLLLAGPWITQVVGDVMSRSGRVAALLAGRRLADSPRVAHRAVASVVLAVLVSSLFVITTPAAAETLTSTDGSGQRSATARASVFYAAPAATARVVDRLSSTPGLRAPTAVYEGALQTSAGAVRVWMADCAGLREAARLDGLPCAEGPLLATGDVADLTDGLGAQGEGITLDSVWDAEVSSLLAPAADAVNTLHLPVSRVAVMPDLGGPDMPDLVVDSSLISEELHELRPTLVVFRYDDPVALEQARTVVVGEVPGASVATRQTVFDGYSQDVRRLYRIVVLAVVGIVVIASFSLVVAAMIGLVERRRPFAMLRAAGASVAVLRKVVLLEVLTPLIVLVALASVLGGLIGSWAAAAAGSNPTSHWSSVLLPAALGVGICLVMTSGALPFVGRVTDGEAARAE
ncbi:ABC transporter permease [Cellulomonas sp. SLBN-39]|uniref:ABC transporter permease n=1 Tax=Cellulomonas sp. SLBN-39 TaxID=2768446 RepID=UPI00115217A1|nr:ABC transporter permease [Cellulomonas sp. SLBN-39]TQL03220.1 FtsX-like permease family protein [Cellulomonas sp. SLBN-39]